ncbi:GlxA family transcriptional regulator [Vibrio sinaloensis]|uniref:GlxA family transcriptional regulator n=1 Tax=Photobacterium sp. (strain ATCC 43367) TaxID=379097 RepID=UPI0020689362|nr:helix-turn-helix domain-containing protein [Vibrio sinaloensis]UPQ89156.1 helix-turn-helix domain-containing protein [Vibrio sinaloensis]
MRLIFYCSYNFQLMDLSGPADVFSIANIIEDKALFELVYVSEHGGLVKSNSGVYVQSTAISEIKLEPDDFVFLINSLDIRKPNSSRVSKFIQQAYHQVESICTVCTGLFTLGNALPRESFSATTHWFYLDDIRRMYPNITLNQKAPYVQDNKIWSSAGISTAIDMALDILEIKTCRELTQHVAMAMVLPNRRKQSDSQLSFYLKMQFECSNSKWEDLLQWIQENIDKELSTDHLSSFMAMSSRNFTRRCKAEFSLTPKKLVDKVRIETAAALIRDSKQTISYIAYRCGYKREENMQRAFVRYFGQSPSEFRKKNINRSLTGE